MASEGGIAIVGVGLIGGSIGLAVRRRDAAARVIGIGRRESSLEIALQRGAITEGTTDLRRGVAEASTIVVCTPVDRIADHVCQAAEAARPGALITDAGSTKAGIVAEVTSRLAAGQAGRSAVFIGSHPLAGSEQAGPAAARPELFDQRLVVVTPTGREDARDVSRLIAFWESLGARVQRLSPDEHDAALADTSHLPHLVASVLAASTAEDRLELTATGWRDTTRVAAGDPELWEQILFANRDHVLRSLDEFAKTLTACRQALADGDRAGLKHLLESGKTRRDAVGS